MYITKYRKNRFEYCYTDLCPYQQIEFSLHPRNNHRKTISEGIPVWMLLEGTPTLFTENTEEICEGFSRENFQRINKENLQKGSGR